MANALCFTPINFFHSTTKPLGIPTGCCLKAPKIHHVHVCIPKNVNFRMIVPKATARGTKPNSIVCADCDGNGAVLCSQCKGTGVNSVDHFNGQFKAGGICWLCRGKKDILCGNCNGAGFMGGFMSTHDD